MDVGPNSAIARPIINPLPVSWLGRADAPLDIPAAANIFRLTSTEIKNLLCQIAYDKSAWNYQKIGASNQLGRYQFSSTTLENYGLLATGSNSTFGTDCVNHLTCWRPTTIRNSNSYATYNYNITSLAGFLNSVASQEHLAYQIVYDLYNTLAANNAITFDDSADMVAGMIYVAWNLGPGLSPSIGYPNGTGAYAWRYWGIGDGANLYNSGRYSVTILSQ